MTASGPSTVANFPSSGGRRLASWVDSFSKYTDGKGSPPLFRKWAGIFSIAAALERKVWIKTAKGILYPNLYLIKVGPPGAGKTLATAISRDLLERIEDLHIAPTSVTKASLIDALNEAERRIIRPQEVPSIIQFNSLTITSDELGVLIPAYENDFMNVLTNIYDCRVYSETRRTNKISIKIENPQLNLMAATTPSYLTNLLPEGAWDQGFLSRTLLIYSGAEAPTTLFHESKYDEKLYADLVADLKKIGGLWGKVQVTQDAAEAITEWHMQGGPPTPDHPKLTHYNTRRTAHLLKLCVIASVSSRDDLIIDVDQFAEALDWLIEVEAAMPDIFKSMTTGGDMRVIEETYHFTWTLWVREKKPILEHRVAHFIAERAPSHNVGRIMEVMERAGILSKKVVVGGGYGYEPRPRKPG